MKYLLRFAIRTALGLLVGANMTFTGALPAQAATVTSWHWTDISSSVPSRIDRPVWALAYAGTGFIGTDGQDLTSGGQVWKTNGSATTDLTAEAISAGLNRVDVIVDDGSSAMLLADAGRATFNVASYDNGLRNRTAEIKSQLDADEAIAAISGKNGNWLIVTTKGNVLEWTPALLSFVKYPVFVDGVANHVAQAALTFRAPQATSDIAPTLVLPVSNGWLIVLPTNENKPQSQYYFYANGSAKEVSNLFPNLGTLSASASNGSQAVLIGADRGTPTHVMGYTYDGVGVTGIANVTSLGNRVAWINAKLAWTGSVWSGYAGKNGFRIENAKLVSTGKSRDYFVAMASDAQGTVMFGGAVSRIDLNKPTNPLTAKLVSLTQSNNIVADKAVTTYTNATPGLKTSVWAWVEPTVTQLDATQNTVYNVGAWSPAGVKRVEITANGVLVQSCDLNNAQGNQVCRVTVKGADYVSSGLVTLQGAVIDGKGQRIVSSETSIAVAKTAASIASSNTAVSDMAAWGWFENGPYVARNGVVVFRSQARASTGLDRIEIFVNGYETKTCAISKQSPELQDCDLLIFGNEYVEGTYGVQVRAYDVNKVELKSQNYNLTFTPADRTGNEMNGVAAIKLFPQKGKYMPDETMSYTISAADPDGVDKVEILIDWESGTTCRGSNTYDAVTCNVSFEGYKNIGKDHTIISRVTDKRGNVVWTGMKTISFASDRASTNMAQAWVSPNKAEIRQDETAVIGATAFANKDVRRIELYVNGKNAYTCTYADGTTEKNCSTQIKGSDYSGNSSVTIQAKVTDSKGISAWSESRVMRVTVDTAGLWYGDKPTLSLWSSRGGEGKLTLTANGQSPAGVQRMDILVNGTSVMSCSNKTACTWTGTVDPSASFSATMVDMYGRLTWSGYAQMAQI